MADRDEDEESNLPIQYTGEIGELRAALQVQDEEIRKLRTMLAGSLAGSIESKYIESLRKAKELKIKLDVERSKTTKQSVQIAELERMLHDATNALVPSHKSRSVDTSNVDDPVYRDLKDKSDRAARNAIELRRTVEDQKKELLKMRKVLQRELGDEIDVDRVCNDPEATWKGRAQQIALLKGKLKTLEKKLEQTTGMEGGDVASVTTAQSVSSSTKRDFNDAYRTSIEEKESKRKIEAREAQIALKAKEEEVSQFQRKYEALQARGAILERENGTLRMSLQRILEKTENDDKLITAYKNEMQAMKEEVRLMKKGGPQGVELPKSNDPQDVIVLQKKLQKLQCEIVESQKQMLHMVGGAQGEDVKSSCPSCNALRIEAAHLRRLVTALQDRLIESVTFVPFDATQLSDTMPTNLIIEKCTLLKAENASLRERLAILQDISQREVSVYKAIAENLRREMEDA